MLGPQGLRRRNDDWAWRGIKNLAVFHDHSNRVSSGLEVNWRQRGNWKRDELTVTPQLHWQLGRHWTIQGGLGLSRQAETSWEPIYSLRVIWER